MPSRARPWISDASLLLAVVIWGLNFPILKAALAVMHPHVINVFRFTVSAVVLGLVYWTVQRATPDSFWQPLREHPWKIAGLGMLGFVLYQFFFIVGVANTAAGTAALIMASAPVWTAVSGALFRTEFLRPLAWVGLAVSLGGTAIVVGGGATGLAPGTLLGNMMMLGAALFWGLYTALNRPVLRTVAPVGLSFFSLLAGLPVLWLIGAPYMVGFDASAVELWVWAAIFFSGALSTGIAVALWNRAIREVGASQTAAYNNLVPFVALLFSFLIISEPVTTIQIAGGALIVGGLVLMRRVRSHGASIPAADRT